MAKKKAARKAPAPRKRSAGRGRTSARGTRAGTPLAVGDHVRVKLGAPQAYRGQTGTIESVEGRARYCVKLEEGITSPLYSWWLEKVEG